MPIAFVALLVTTTSAPVVRAALLRQGVLDVPNHRSSHETPVPRGGGLACLAGSIAACLVGVLTQAAARWYLLVPCLVVAVVGYVDDRRGLPAAPRLAVQLLSGAVLGFALHGVAGAVLGGILMAWVVNVVNFMDGINGITALTMALWGGVTLAVGLTHSTALLTGVGAVSAGAALGFLPWNLPVARMFLGDSGSYLFGALAAAGLLVAWTVKAPLPLVAAPLFLYAVDTTAALVRRARRGERLTEAHREHVYQQLTSGLGYPHWRVSVGLCLVSAGVTASWLLAWPVALVVTIAVGSLYLALPSLLRRGAPTYPSLPGRQST